jgi:hypothetical protein
MAVRFLIVLLIGIGFALGLYYGGWMQWLNDRWSGYGTYPPPAVVETPVPVPGPVANYPGTTPVPAPGVLPTAPPSYEREPPPYSNGEGERYANGQDEDDEEEPEYDEPPSSEPTDTPPGAIPPVGLAPVGNGPPISLQISMGHRSYGKGCEPAYTVFNDTSRPIILTERARYRWNGRGPKDAFIVQPGERQIACAADVYQASDRYPRFDYYRQNVHYGPDAIDLPPPVDIRVKE